MQELISDTLTDGLWLFVFLFGAYCVLEFIEHHLTPHLNRFIKKSGAWGPVIGALAGVFPQCGFAVVAANFYAAHIITAGTLLAVFLSTSDAMIPILLSRHVSGELLGIILVLKVGIGMICGLVADKLYPQKLKIAMTPLCQQAHCQCHQRFWLSALVHSVQITLFVMVVMFLLGLCPLADYLSASGFQGVITGAFLGGLVGLIPSCSVSVLLTEFYVDNLLPFGTFIAGVLANAGMGLLVFIRVNPDKKQTAFIVAVLYGVSVCAGLLLNLCGVK